MTPVETYIPVDQDIITRALDTKTYINFQGGNLLFEAAIYSKTEVTLFLVHVFDIVDKIAMKSFDGSYYMLSNKFDSDVIEPFSEHKDVSKQLGNDIEKIAEFICHEV